MNNFIYYHKINRYILTRIEINKNFILEIDNEYVFTDYITIFKARECAYYYNFILHKDYELF